MFKRLDNGEIVVKEINSQADFDDELVGHPDVIYNCIDQIGRIEWLKTQHMKKPIMEIGTACGHVLSKVDGDIGIDIRPDRLLVAKLKYPNKKFYYCNSLNLEPFYSKGIQSVIIAELLEHMTFESAFYTVIQSLKVAPFVYYTLPNIDKDINVSKNLEHKWYPTRENTKILMDNVNNHIKIIYDINEIFGFLCGTIKRI